MSKTFSIACTQCKKQLWIAQGHGYPIPTKLSFYSGEPETIEALENFLMDHFKHPLIFDENCESDLMDYEDMTPDVMTNRHDSGTVPRETPP